MGGMMVERKCVLRKYVRPLDWFVERVYPHKAEKSAVFVVPDAEGLYLISVSNHPPRCTGYRWSPVSWRQELLYARSLLPPPSLRDARRNRCAGALERAILALPSSPSSLLCKPTAKCPRTALSPLFPPPYFVSPLQSVHALLSPFFSLLPPFYFSWLHFISSC